MGNDFLSAADSNILQYVHEKAGQESSTIMAVTNFASQFSSMKCFAEHIALIPLEMDKKKGTVKEYKRYTSFGDKQ